MTAQGKSSTVAATYRYTDEEDQILFEVVRKKNPKGFFQRRPDGQGGWINGVEGVRRVLFQLPDVVAAVENGDWVYVVEGEKDAKRLSRLKLVATTNSGGPGRWKEEHSKSLLGARVVIIPDNDKEGRQHAQKVARALHGVASEVRVLALLDLPEGGDISDWLTAERKAGRGKETRTALEALVEKTSAWVPEAEPEVFGTTSGTEDKPKQSEILIELAGEAGVELFHTPSREEFASLPVDGHRETWGVRSKTLKLWLIQQYYSQMREAPSAQAIKEAQNTLAAKAIFDGEEHEVFTRIAESGGAVYLDLCDEDWQAVKVTRRGWRVISDPPVRFRRSRGMRPLPQPVRGGSIENLRLLVNLPDENSFVLVVAFLVGALRHRGPCPLLVLNGEQGSSKSTLARTIRALVDPAEAPLRTLPRSERDLMISASGSWLQCFDNLSGLKDWQSDAFCRLATGGGLATRQLYSDEDEVIFSAMRPVVLNGIDEIVGRQDLVDRSLILTLQAIRDENRRPEKQLWAEFDRQRPKLLGALLDAVSCALRREATVKLDRPPRMADFAQWVAAAEEALPWPQGTFIKAYQANRVEAVSATLEDDDVVGVVRHVVEMVEEITDTPSEIYELLTAFVEDVTGSLAGWPKSPRAFSARLKRLAPALRIVGIDVQFSRTAKQRSICLAKRTPPKQRHQRHQRHKAQNTGGSDDATDSGVTTDDAKGAVETGPDLRLDDAGDANDAKFLTGSQVSAPDDEELRI